MVSHGRVPVVCASEGCVAVDVDGTGVLTVGCDWYETNTRSPWLDVWWALVSLKQGQRDRGVLT